MWVEDEVEGRKEGGRWNVEQCVRTTPFREPLSRAAWPSTLSISLHKALRPPFNDEDNDYDGRTTRRRSCALLLRLSHYSPCSFSLFLSPFPYLPTRLQSLILPLPYVEPTTYTITRSLSNSSLSRFTLLVPLLSPFLSSHLLPSDSTASFLPILFSATVYYRMYLCLSHFPSSLFLFLSWSLASSRVLLPAIHPLTLVLTGIASRSLTLIPSFSSGRRRLTRALILPYPLPRP